MLKTCILEFRLALYFKFGRNFNLETFFIKKKKAMLMGQSSFTGKIRACKMLNTYTLHTVSIK